LRYFYHIKNIKNHLKTMIFHQPNSIKISNFLMPLNQQTQKIKQSYNHQIRIFIMSTKAELQKQIKLIFNSKLHDLGFKNSLKKEYSLTMPVQNEETTIRGTIKTLWKNSVIFIKNTLSSFLDPMKTIFSRKVKKKPYFPKKRWKKLLKTFKYKRAVLFQRYKKTTFYFNKIAQQMATSKTCSFTKTDGIYHFYRKNK
jgi:hypothetical protein